MQREQLLEQKLRKSQSLTEKDIYQDFMQYAREVSDQMDIYLYMQQNGIGTDLAKYWIARMEIMRRRCQLIELVKLLNTLNSTGNIEQSWEINKYYRNLGVYLRSVFNMQFKGKRRAADFNRSVESIHPERRKIGNIQVYVDEACRNNYELEDFAEYIQNKMLDYCQIEKQDYKRIQDRKPPSFIAKRQQHLIELAQQVLNKAGRKSHHERKSFGLPRPSNKLNTQGSNIFEVENYNTPKNHQVTKVESSQRTSEIREKRKKDSSRDSIQILKSMKKDRKQENEFKSPKFIESSHLSPPEDLQLCIQRCRSVPEADNNSFLSFSFGKGKQQAEQQQKQRVMNQKYLQNKDNAFLFNSFSQDAKFIEKQNFNLIRKEDFELQLIIKEIQREKYEKIDSKTYSSDLDSNLENQCFNQFGQNESNKKQRKPFEILLQAEGRLLKSSNSMKLEQLMDFDDQNENKNPEDGQFQQDYTFDSAQKRPSIHLNEYHSQNKKYLSNISEQKSNIYSQSQNKYTRSK